jgi:hypothetical protein
VDIDLKEIIVAAGANFEYKSPGNFSADVVNILEILFYLFLEHAEIPEFVMGNAISSSKASAETQMPVFERFIEGQQSDAKDWLTQVSEIVLAYQSLIMPGVTSQTPSLQWRKLTQDGRLTLDTIVWAVQAGLLDKRTALMLAPVEVEDIDAVLEAAEEEKEQRRETALAIGTPRQPQDEEDERPEDGAMGAPVSNEDDSGVNEMTSNEVAAIVEAAAHIIAENGYV